MIAWRQRFVIVGVLVALGGCFIPKVQAFFPLFGNPAPKPIKHLEPVIKSYKRPVLSIEDPRTQSKIHLVGVSHGSPSSADLVREVFGEVNPKAVVVELCDDRFLSISIDSKIRPRFNPTFTRIYDEKVAILEKRAEKQKAEATSYANYGLFAVFSQLSSAFKFAKSQGVFGGVFVLLGLLVSSLQRASRGPSTSGDEFVTAMIEAEKINIPVLLGDAPQNDTLNSIKGVISKDIFVPNKIIQGAKLLVSSHYTFEIHHYS
jgi:hypothetical protein